MATYVMRGGKLIEKPKSDNEFMFMEWPGNHGLKDFADMLDRSRLELNSMLFGEWPRDYRVSDTFCFKRNTPCPKDEFCCKDVIDGEAREVELLERS